MSEVRDLSCKSDNPPQEPEVRVDVRQGDQWVRIPVTSVELWINKDGPADVTRHAKVRFPTEWGGNDITQYINGLQASEERDDSTAYDRCRIWFYDHETNAYQIAHYGYIGGVGPSDTGVNKMMVYDPADLMRKIQVSKSFGDPTIAQVASFCVNGEDDNGNPVGLEQRSVFKNISYYIAGPQEVKNQKTDMRDLGGAEPSKSDISIMGFNLSDYVDDIFDFYFGSEVTGGVLGGQKRFQFNRHNLVDVMDWFMSEIGGRWFFEPSPEGPILFIDNTNAQNEEGERNEDGDYARRLFIDDMIGLADRDEPGLAPNESPSDQGFAGDISEYTDRHAFTTVDVIDNTAMYDIKPFNALELMGESRTFRERYGRAGGTMADEANFGGAGSPGAYTEVFPYVKVTYPPLVERAGGYEYTAPAVESDKVYLDQAVRQAKKEFEKHLEEESEGSITIKGEPFIMPHDYIQVIPHCGDTFANTEVNPITYEVNRVKHKREAGSRYTTELGVSLVYDESLVEIEKEYRRA